MKKRRKKNYVGRIILLFILLIFVLVIAFIILFKDDIEKKVTNKVATTAIEQIINSQTGVSVDIDDVKSQMDEEDEKEFDEIIDKYTDTDKLKECIDLYKTGGTTAVKDYIKSEVEESDIDKLKELYYKYEDSIDISNE